MTAPGRRLAIREACEGVVIIESIREMCRVSKEARIFPLQQLGASPSPYVPAVVDYFEDAGYGVDIVRVPYEFQRGGNQMLRIRHAEQPAGGAAEDRTPQP